MALVDRWYSMATQQVLKAYYSCMSKLPEWLPVEVAFHVKATLNKGGLGDAEETLCRLTYDPEMEKVWAALQSQSGNPQHLIEYLEYVRLHPVVMGWPSDLLNVPGDAVQREQFGKIAGACEAALSALEKLSHKRDRHEGWALLEMAIQRNERQAAETNDGSKLEAITNFQSHLREIQQISDVVEIVRIIRLAAALASDAPDMPLPRRRDSVNADRVLLAQELSRYMQHNFHKPLHAVVATTVNVALALHDNIMTPDAVRKLKLS